MELEGRLAESWSFGAQARYFFDGEEAGTQAWEALEGAKDRWAGWGVTATNRAEADEIWVEFNAARTTAPDEILALFPEEGRAEPVKWELQTSDAAGETVRNYADTALEGGQIRYLWSDGAGKAEFYTIGKTERFRREVTLFYESNEHLRPRLKETGPQPYLFTPNMTLNLRNGVRWHDGKPFTVDDVLHSLSMALDSQSQPEVASAMESFERLEPRRPLSLRVHFREMLGRPLEMWEQLPILPAHAVHFYVPGERGLPPLIGTGPFQIARWEPEQPIVLTRNDDYFRGRPENQRLIYERVLEARMRRILFQINSIDSYEAKPTTYANLENRENFDLVKSPPVTLTYIGWNLGKDVFADPRVRRALAMAIDSQALIDELLGGNGEMVDRLFHPGAGVEGTLQPLAYDPAEALNLLEKAGWSNVRYGARHKDRVPLTFKLTVVGGDDLQRSLARALVSQWRRIGDKVGAQVQLHIASYAEISKLRHGNADFDAVLMNEPLSWHFDRFGNWHSSQIGPGRGNFTRLQDEKLDGILAQLRLRPEDPQKLATDLQDRLFELQPLCPLFLRGSARVFQRGRAIVIDKTGRQGPDTRAVGENQVSLTHDLAWWAKRRDGGGGMGKEEAPFTSTFHPSSLILPRPQ